MDPEGPKDGSRRNRKVASILLRVLHRAWQRDGNSSRPEVDSYHRKSAAGPPLATGQWLATPK